MPKNWKIRFFGNFFVIWTNSNYMASSWKKNLSLVDRYQTEVLSYIFFLLKDSFKRWMAMGVLMVWYMR